MEVTNREQALQYIAVWRSDLHAGINAVTHGRCARMFRISAEGMDRCVAITRSQGRVQLQADYAAAREVLVAAAEFHAQESEREDREWVQAQEAAAQASDARILKIRNDLGLA